MCAPTCAASVNTEGKSRQRPNAHCANLSNLANTFATYRFERAKAVPLASSRQDEENGNVSASAKMVVTHDGAMASRSLNFGTSV